MNYVVSKDDFVNTPLSALNLTVRARNVLHGLGVKVFSDILSLSPRKIFRTLNSGKKTTAEIVEFIHSHGYDFGQTFDLKQGAQENSNQEDDNQTLFDMLPYETKKIICTKISEVNFPVRLNNILIGLSCEYIGDILQYSSSYIIKRPNAGKKSILDLINFLAKYELSLETKYRDWDREVCKSFRRKTDDKFCISFKGSSINLNGTLLDQFHQFTKHFSDERRAKIICSLYGWDGLGSKTLQQTGDLFKMTRERVRQISSKFEKKVLLTQSRIDLADEIISKINSSVPCWEDSIILESGFSSFSTLEDALISYSGILEEKISWQRIQGNNKSFLIPSSLDAEIFKKALSFLRKQISLKGCCLKEEYKDFLLEHNVDSRIVDMAFSQLLHKDFFEFSHDSHLIGIKDINQDRCRSINRIKKVFSICKKIHPSSLRKVVNRSHRMDNLYLSTSEIISICIEYNLANYQDDLLVCLISIPENTLSESEKILSDAFEKLTTPIHVSELSKYCIDRGMSEVNFGNILQNSPIVERIVPGIYKRIDQEADLLNIDEIRNNYWRSSGKRLLQDFGRDGEGYLWIKYKLTGSSLRSGVLTIPAKISSLLSNKEWQLKINEDRKVRIASNQSQIYGFLSCLRAYGVEVGDEIQLSFQPGGIIQFSIIDEQSENDL